MGRMAHIVPGGPCDCPSTAIIAGGGSREANDDGCALRQHNCGVDARVLPRAGTGSCLMRARKHHSRRATDHVPAPTASAPVALVDSDFSFTPPSADDLCDTARGLIAEGASHEQVLHALIEQYGYCDELLGRASALADERFLRGGDWTWYETSRSFQTMLGPGSF